MAGVRKFLFETSFDPAPAPEAVHPVEPEAEDSEPAPLTPADAPPLLTPEDIEILKQEAWREGYEAAMTEAMASLEQKQAEALQRISEQLTFLEESCQDGIGQFVQDAVRVSSRLVKALSPQLLQMSKDKEIGALLEQCFRHLRHEVQLVIRGAPADESLLQGLSRRMAQSEGFRGELIIETDPALFPGDCVVSWQDGKAERLRQTIEQRIEALIAAAG